MPWQNEPPQLLDDLHRASHRSCVPEAGAAFTRFPTALCYDCDARAKITGGRVLSSTTRPTMGAEGLHRSQSFLGHGPVIPTSERNHAPYWLDPGELL
jgi:hypothetical protein